MSDRERIFIHDASGHAKVEIDILERQGDFVIDCRVMTMNLCLARR